MYGYQHTAHNISHTYRPLAIALLFGLVCLACMLVCLCACIGRTPRLTSFFLLILWIFVGFILLIGAGLPLQQLLRQAAPHTLGLRPETLQQPPREVQAPAGLSAMQRFVTAWVQGWASYAHMHSCSSQAAEGAAHSHCHGAGSHAFHQHPGLQLAHPHGGHAGALKAPLKLSKDGCLYAETYIQTRVTSDNSSPAKVAQIQAGIEYYAGKTTLTPAEAFEEIFGVNLTGLTSYASDGQVGLRMACS